MEKQSMWIMIGAILGALSVGLGAFGAHIIESRLNSDDFSTFQTAVEYQFYHTFALILTGIIYSLYPTKTLLNRISWSFFIGILIFSGSLYLLLLTDQSWFGAITPIGGVAFILGWIQLAYFGYQLNVQG